MRSERREKRFIPVLVAGAVGIGAALGWMQTNGRMNGLEQQMQVKEAVWCNRADSNNVLILTCPLKT
jgi:hypothetical protein